jgi:hypothetical protein
LSPVGSPIGSGSEFGVLSVPGGGVSGVVVGVSSAGSPSGGLVSLGGMPKIDSGDGAVSVPAPGAAGRSGAASCSPFVCGGVGGFSVPGSTRAGLGGGARRSSSSGGNGT